tara:strand:- start:792 stop:1481 length:690 start_codon:yes stop_codon:yes gene_type:complete
MNKFEEYFFNKTDKTLKSCKYHEYLKIYDRHFKTFIGKNPKILEIGVQGGGSLEMWNCYFDKECEIYGIDIDPRCLTVPDKLQSNNIHVTIGNQGSSQFWEDYMKTCPTFDIIIDDGGHTATQQRCTFSNLYNNKMKDNGVYLCEDLHTSYWKEFGGGYRDANSFMEFSKNLTDSLNADHFVTGNVRHSTPNANPTDMNFCRTTNSIHFYDSVVVFEKQKNEPMTHSTR